MARPAKTTLTPMAHAEVISSLRTAVPILGWPGEQTMAEHEKAARDLRELIAKTPSARNDQDVVACEVATHRHDGSVWLVWSRWGRFPLELAAVPMSPEGLAYLTNPDFEHKAERRRIEVHNKKASVWVALDRDEQALLVMLASAPAADRAALVEVCKRFVAVRDKLPILGDMPPEVVPLIDASRAPSDEIAREARARKRELARVEEDLRNRAAQREKWANQAEHFDRLAEARRENGVMPICETREVG